LGRNGVFGAISGQFPAKFKNYQTGVCMGGGSCNYRIQWKALAKAHILDSFPTSINIKQIATIKVPFPPGLARLFR
jgi:hypothetical protein